MISFIPQFVPNLIQVVPFVLAFSVLCANPLRKYPGFFYGIWAAAATAITWPDVIAMIFQTSTPAFVSAYEAGLSSLEATMPAFNTIIELLTSSYTGVCFYLIVMFIGALEKTPTIKKLLSVRSELSILGGIIIMAHVVRVIDFPFLFSNQAWVDIWGYPAAHYMFVAAVIIGPLLTLTFLIPWLTSFKFIKRRMPHATWKKTQMLAYPFMALMIGQGFFLALGHALIAYPFDGYSFSMAIMSDPIGWLETFAQQVATAWMYLAIGVAYAVTRLRKRSRDKARKRLRLEKAA